MFTVAALYRFARFDDPEALRDPLRRVCDDAGVRGSILLAPEGINGTIAGSRAGIAQVLAHIRGLPGCARLDVKESHAAELPFNRMKVRLKREIVTMHQPDVDPTAAVGHYVPPAEWNALISAEDVVVIDTRNDYEVALGSFKGAINPGTRSFGEFPDWWAENAERFAGKRIAMFCTGGIRCEKSTSYLRGQGVEEVFHLDGGILRYLEDVPEPTSLWRGDCYVFDKRVSVRHGVVQGDYTLCHACGRPAGPDDRAHPYWEDGVQCAACVDEYDERDRTRFRERQRQAVLQRARRAAE
ncbi:oxygen-dependent tRNA uridine(34) hydroxylase TrhO [Brevirhabdus sp.]|uniref:oxygen-dependent tRNA uridine(34) hydroxylase TrhO n=1 Tax=Brevirhabdus sp. TaxID=2004514 RepID=UPI004059223E